VNSTTSLGIVAWSCIGLWLAGCMSTLPTERELAEIEAGDRTLVLLRLVPTVDGEAYEPVAGIGSAVDDFGLHLTQFGDCGVGGFARSPDAASRRAGWAYAVLDPGTYYLELSTPPASPMNDRPGVDPGPTVFRLDVPVDARAAYVGSIEANVLTAWGLFGRIPAGFEAGSVHVRDERVEAESLVRAHLPQFGTPATSLLVRHEGGTRIIRTPER
jgi:hypothetical protein